MDPSNLSIILYETTLRCVIQKICQDPSIDHIICITFLIGLKQNRIAVSVYIYFPNKCFSFLFLVVIVGLMQRALLDKFYLLAVPRLSILLAVVILLYILFAIAADSFGILAVNNKTLNYFPIVIITVFIERFSIYYIEEGASNTLKTSLGTFVVAALCYYLLAFKWLKVFLFNNPEMLLLAVGLNLMIGSYRGYRLFELFRFAQLKEDEDGVFS